MTWLSAIHIPEAFCWLERAKLSPGRLCALILLCAVAVVPQSLATKGQLSAQTPQPPVYEQRLVVFLERSVPPSDAVREPAVLAHLQRQHLANIRSLAESGLLYLAGPITGDEDDDLRGVLIFGPPTEQLTDEVSQRLLDDPLIAAGYLRPRFRTLTFERGNTLDRPISDLISKED